MDLEQRVATQDATINRLEVELASIKEKVSFFNIIYGKFDVTLGKIQELIENRRYENNVEIKEVYSDMEASEDRILAEITKLREEMREFDKWRWMIVGGITIIGFIINLVI